MVQRDAIGLEKVRKSLIFKGKPDDFCLARVSLTLQAVSPDRILIRSSIMKKTILALSLAALSVPALAQGKKPEPEYTISGNFGVFSDYRFRGISQTRLAPALQGGFDFAHKSGLYLGNWNSNVSSNQFLDGGGIEMDFYGGYKTELFGIGLDLGAIYYHYPEAKIRTAQQNTSSGGPYDNGEVYVGITYGPLTLKTSYAVTNYFGLNWDNDIALGAPNKARGNDSKGTIYYDLSFSKEIFEKTTFIAHYGRTAYANFSELDYNDYKIGVNIDLSGWTLGLAYVTTDGMNATYKTNFYTNTGDYGKAKSLYKSTALLSISKTF
jgi:uncharacterized protein (TIGR02001 family)